ncbi:MAG: PhoH family protein [Erysipelotrichaceae bacterium]|nr:PhoH family protein [Erysipelotrichaceae bacterium]
MKYKEILLDDINQDELKNLYGVDNQNINILSDLFNREIIARGNCILVDFDIYNDLYEIINQLINMIKHNHQIDENTVKHTYNNLKNHIDNSFQNLIAITTNSGKPIKYKTYKQYLLSEIINKNDLVFSIGPAGTGKTFLAVLLAVKALKNGEVKKIILTRPAVEAGESLGFLPGDLKEKINPYLMPLYDSLEDILGSEQVEKLIEKEIIEVIPLAYMRGRTLNDAFIILDEAQNTTDGQMLMFLTRLGYNSKMIVNGDLTQIDLNINKNKSGLVVAVDKLKKIKGIDFIEFDNNDIVRNPIVSKIIDRFKK